MSTATQHPDARPIDPLGEALHLLRLTGTLYCSAELTAPWGVDVPALDGCMTLQVVTTGQCWLDVDGADPLLLRKGTLTLIPHGTPHRFRSDPAVATEPLFDLPVEQISERYERLRHGGGGALTRVTYAVLRLDHAAAQRLVPQLPAVLQINDFDDDGWLDTTLRLISREAQALHPGGETVVTRLADILVILTIRSWLDSAPQARQGWLAALRDEHVGRALASIHRAPERSWSVALLAREVGMSRSAFSARFTDMVGESVMRYLTNWRLQLAQAHLRESSEPLSVVARRFGYQSEPAFCRAFKRTFGVPPGTIRRPVAASATGTTGRSRLDRPWLQSPRSGAGPCDASDRPSRNRAAGQERQVSTVSAAAAAARKKGTSRR